MYAACIDMEGVLIPEMWPRLAHATGVAELAVTTREQPDYPSLVQRRLALLRQHGLKLADVVGLIAPLAPLPGAAAFLQALAQRYRVLLVSDAFEQMLSPLHRQLGHGELLCHRFLCDPDGYIAQACYSRREGKHEVIRALQQQGYQTLAVGDAFNDIGMLRLSQRGFLFRPSPETQAAAPDLTCANNYREILRQLAPRPTPVARVRAGCR